MAPQKTTPKIGSDITVPTIIVASARRLPTTMAVLKNEKSAFVANTVAVRPPNTIAVIMPAVAMEPGATCWAIARMGTKIAVQASM